VNLLSESVIAGEVFVRFCGIVHHLHEDSCFLPGLNILKPFNFHSANSTNSTNSLNSFDSYGFGQVAGLVGVASSIDSEIISEELKGNHGNHRIE